jgi:hypothetical protein
MLATPTVITTAMDTSGNSRPGQRRYQRHGQAPPGWPDCTGPPNPACPARRQGGYSDHGAQPRAYTPRDRERRMPILCLLILASDVSDSRADRPVRCCAGVPEPFDGRWPGRAGRYVDGHSVDLEEHPAGWWPGPPRRCVDDECRRTAGLQHVVDGLGHWLLGGSAERLALGHQACTALARPRAGPQPGHEPHRMLLALFSSASRPPSASLPRRGPDRPSARADAKRAVSTPWAAAEIREPAVPVHTRLLPQDGLELR